MPIEKRKFVIEVAAAYRMDTQMVDQEPHRSVQVLRRIDTRIPRPLLSKHISAAPSPSPSPGLGRLATKLPPPSSSWGNTNANRAASSSTGWLTAKPTESSGLSRESSRSELNGGASLSNSWMARRAEFLRNSRESPAVQQDDTSEVTEKPAIDDWEDDEEI
jgi:transcriptional repressor NF-X1